MCSFVGESMKDDSSLVFAYYKDGKSDPTFLYFSDALKEVKCWLISYLSCCSTVLVELLVYLCNPLSIGRGNWKSKTYIHVINCEVEWMCLNLCAQCVCIIVCSLWNVILGWMLRKTQILELMNLVMIFEIANDDSYTLHSGFGTREKFPNANPDGILHMISSSHVIHMWRHVYTVFK